MHRILGAAALLVGVACGGDAKTESGLGLSFADFAVTSTFLSEVRDTTTSRRMTISLVAADAAKACDDLATQARPTVGTHSLTVGLGGGEGWDGASACPVGDSAGPCAADVQIMEASADRVRYWRARAGSVRVLEREEGRLKLELDATFPKDPWWVCDSLDTGCMDRYPDELDPSGATERLQITLEGTRAACAGACRCYGEGETCGC